LERAAAWRKPDKVGEKGFIVAKKLLEYSKTGRLKPSFLASLVSNPQKKQAPKQKSNPKQALTFPRGGG
jgi:hypothetical protein